MSRPTEERRRHPRYARALPLRRRGAEDFSVLETENVSLGGALCRVDRYLPIMTKLHLHAELPDGQGPFEAEAVVVRVEPEEPRGWHGEYRVALFFQRMEDKDRRALRTYLEG